jgi:tetratricopeptide (TPR) repeat protein
MNRARVLTAAAALLASGLAFAQVAPLKLPDVSQKASVTQTVGLTEIAVGYHRPSVNKREVWGKLVPYGEVWRAGANENTTISFSTDVTVGGTKVPAGTYGLHVLPTAQSWTFILNKQANNWGSFSYEAKDDLLRVPVTPQAADFAEQVTYTFDDPKADGVLVTLHWEKIKASLPVGVDTNAVVVASLRDQLHGIPQFSWQGWNQAANWCINHDVNLDEAGRWVDKSIGMTENFTNLMTKARLLDKKGQGEQATALRKTALTKATEVEINAYGYQLLGQKKVDEAIAIFDKNVKDHPESWNVHDSLAEAYAIKGDKAKAIALYQKARGMTKLADQQKRIDVELAKLKG